MSSKGKHILITTAWYPTAASTSGVFVKEQGEALVRAGNKVVMLLVTYSTIGGWLKGNKTKFDPSGTMNVQHLHVIFRMPGRFYANPQASFKKSILSRATSWMKNYIKANGKPDVIHHHCISDNAYVALHLSETFGIPYVFTEHSNYFRYEEVNRFNTFESFEDHQRFVRAATTRIAVSEVRAKGYENIFGAPFITVSNMVSQLFASPLPTAPKPEIFTFVCVALLDKRKRQDLLIRAFASVFGGKDVKLQLVGAGNSRNDYIKLIEELGMNHQISLLGKKNRTEVLEIFDRAHVCVLSSDQETFGVVLAEAMFRGLPVISTICGGPEEIVTPECGLLVEKGNQELYAAALVKMHATYTRYTPESIRAYAMSRFSEQIVISSLESIYNSCVHSAKGA